MSKYSLFAAMQKVKNIVSSQEFFSISRKTTKAFTRQRKMSFCDIIYFIISSKRRCVQHELDDFFKQKGNVRMSRQAFAQAREKIKPEAIKLIDEGVLADFEKHDTHIKTLHGLRVFAVDGSYIDLPENKILRATFGYTSGSNDTSHCKGRAMIAQDLFNRVCVYGEMTSLQTSEKTQMYNVSDYISNKKYYENCIFVLDRAYPSLKLFMKIESNHQHYLARATKSFYKDIVNAPKKDQIVRIKQKDDAADVRVIKFILPSGETEILVCNLPEIFTYEEIVNLYARRWGVETSYHYIKNVELLECFTGESVAAVLQDFYASILMLNIAAIAYREQEDILSKENTGAKQKYNYKPNNKQIICEIKRDFIKMLSAKNRFSKVFKQFFLLIKIKRFSYADVPGRSKPRKDPKRHSTLKSHPKMPL